MCVCRKAVLLQRLNNLTNKENIFLKMGILPYLTLLRKMQAIRQFTPNFFIFDRKTLPLRLLGCFMY